MPGRGVVLNLLKVVGCGETDGGDMREETEVGNACGGKPRSHGSKAILLSHA